MSQIVGLTAAWQQDKVEGNPEGANILVVMLKQTPILFIRSSTSFYEPKYYKIILYFYFSRQRRVDNGRLRQTVSQT